MNTPPTPPPTPPPGACPSETASPLAELLPDPSHRRGPELLRAALGRAGLSQGQFARLLSEATSPHAWRKVHRVSVSQWIAGETLPPDWVRFALDSLGWVPLGAWLNSAEVVRAARTVALLETAAPLAELPPDASPDSPTHVGRAAAAEVPQ